MKTGSKQKTLSALLLVFALLLAACGGAAAEGEASGEVLVEEPEVEEALEPEIELGGLCANQYFPVLLNATWDYKGTGEEIGDYTSTDTITEVREDGYTLTSQFEGLTRTQEWACTPEGLSALEYESGSGSSAGLSTAGMTAEFDTTNVEGISLPKVINAGDTWQQSFEITGTINMAEGMSAGASGTVLYDFEAMGMETVTVPAGTFEAMKLQIHITFNMVVDVQGMSLPIAFESDTSTWYAPGVGWVKSDESTSLDGGDAFVSGIELQAYAIP
jgi:hypothetical protein